MGSRARTETSLDYCLDCLSKPRARQLESICSIIIMSEQAARIYVICQSVFTATRSTSQFQGMIKPEFQTYRMFWKFCLQLQGIGQPHCSTSKDIWSMLQGGSVFRYQPVDQQITARTVAAPATHRPTDLLLTMLSMSLPTQGGKESDPSAD